MTEYKANLHEFLAEAEDIIGELTDSLVKLGEGIDSGRIDPDLLNSVFRSAHTLKGVSGMFGFNEMAMLTHKMEDMFDSLRMGRLSLNHEIMNALFESVDMLNEMIVRKGRDEEFGADKVESIIARLEHLSGGSKPVALDTAENANIDKSVLSALTEYEEHRFKENINAGNNIFLIGAEFTLTVFDEGLVELTGYLKSVGEVIATLPSTGKNKDLLHFDILFGTGKDAAFIEDILKDRNLAVKAVKKHPTPKGAAVKHAYVEIPSEPKPEEVSMRSVSNTVRVDIEKLDSIMNTVGELSQLKTSIARIADTIRLEIGSVGPAVELSRAIRVLEKRLRELQESMIDVRMVPVHQLFDKFTRVVKKLSRETGKGIELVTSGGDTELDKLIVEDLADPLMHIIRNAIDHGIEPPEERERKGKSMAGTIHLRAYPKGNHVTIEVEDDGRGMNTEAIRKKAVESRLIDEASSHALSRQNILDFIFIPGFSTKDEVSEVSGRGVGMDVVKKNITDMSGTVDIDTEEGKGTRIILTLPITLAIIQSLIIAAGSRRYALPLAGVQEILNIRPLDIKTMEKKEVYVLRGKTIPVLRLEQFFDPSAAIKEKAEMSGIIVGIADSMLCILIDSIISQQDVVIKSLGRLLQVTGIAGATDLGDMGTLLVIDVAGIIAATGRRLGERAA